MKSRSAGQVRSTSTLDRHTPTTSSGPSTSSATDPVRLLCIDPGATVGVAILDREGRVLEAYTIEDTVAGVAEQLLRVEADEVVIEKGPHFSNSPYTQNLQTMLGIAFKDHSLTWMLPAEWKDHPEGKKVYGDDHQVIPNVHCRDAAGMGRVYLRKTAWLNH